MTQRLFLSAILTGAWCAAAPLVWYVSPDGNDAWTGTSAAPNPERTDGPFATLAAARDASRKAGGEPRRIVLAAGRFFLAEPLLLEAQDSGLSIEGAGAGKTILYGGQRLQGWAADGEKLWSVKLPAEPANRAFRVLVVNDAIQDRARLPEKGYLEHESTFNVRWMSTAGGGWERKPTPAELTTLRYKAGDLPTDLRSENAEVTVSHMWDESTVAVAGHDAATRTLTFASPCEHPPGAFGVPRYAVWNTREGMTHPGQWYLDRVERKVTYWPRAGEDVTSAVVVAPTMDTLIRIAGQSQAHAADIGIRALTLAAADAPLKPAGFGAVNWPGAIDIAYGDRVSVQEVEVANAGGWGVREWGGRELTVQGSRLHHLGGGGVRFGEAARIDGNTIHDIGLVSASAIGIVGGGTRSLVRRNVIHDTPYSGMCVSGTETVIEENLLYRCMLVHHDGAAIYMGGGQRCIIRRNLARDMAEVGAGYGVSAYYLDEKCQNCLVAENVAINIAMPAHNHMTLNCELRDNVFIHDGDMQISFARCAGHKVSGNTFHTGGKFEVREPEAIAEWKDNRIVARTAAGGTISDALPAAPFTPREEPRSLKPSRLEPPPTIDGKMGADEWPSGGTALGERPNQRSVRGAPTSVKIHVDDTCLYILANTVTMFPEQRKLGTEWGKDEGVELVLEAKAGAAAVVHVLRGFSDGTFHALEIGGASAGKAAAFAKTVRYGASVDKTVWRAEWAVPLAELGVAPGAKALVPFNLTVYRSEDDVFAQYAGTLGETWDLKRGGRLMLNWDQAPAATAPLAVAAQGPAPAFGGATPGEWPGTALKLAQTPDGAPLAAAPASANVVRSGGDLFVRIVVPVVAAKNLTKGAAWRTDDGAEVCILGQTAAGAKAVWVVHGFAGGAFELSDEAGVPVAVNAGVRDKVAFAARITATGWEGEWRLPLAVLGIKTDAPAPFNLGVYRSEDRQWLNWIGTAGPTWKLESAGRLKLE
jgi:hypothetical protein